MSPASRYEEWLCRLAWVSPILAVAATVWLVYRYLPLAGVVPSSCSVPVSPPAWRTVSVFDGIDWGVLHGRGGALPANQGTLASRFRLVGTFFAYGGGEQETQKAIIEDLKGGSQTIVAENDLLDDVTVVRILRERVVLRAGAEEGELWLEFARTGEGRGAGAHGTGDTGIEAGGPSAWLGGQQVDDNRWMFSRERLMEYYASIMDEPERAVALFDSLAPLYDQGGRITGYTLDVQGEADFFDAVGMKPGDVVRKVNSMPMVSRQRAEFFIREFVNEKANAIVLDIERDGKEEKLIYQVR